MRTNTASIDQIYSELKIKIKKNKIVCIHVIQRLNFQLHYSNIQCHMIPQKSLFSIDLIFNEPCDASH